MMAKKVNSLWRSGGLRHITNAKVSHPITGESMSYDQFVSRFAREQPGFHHGARVFKR